MWSALVPDTQTDISATNTEKLEQGARLLNRFRQTPWPQSLVLPGNGQGQGVQTPPTGSGGSEQQNAHKQMSHMWYIESVS